MNSRRRLLVASVISIQNSRFVYPSCHCCFSKLILNSNRFNCVKCGCTGEAKDANYRYKLSLKVADTNNLFDVTVFGSSLDPLFGVPARSLHRCIQDFNQVSGEQDRNASPAELIQAVKTCFVGRRFLFVLKSSENHGGGHCISGSLLQNCSKINRLTRDFKACQIFLPHANVAGFTVISYFHQLLQSANFKSSDGSSQRTIRSLTGLDQPSSELSSLCCSGSNSCFLTSSVQESFSGPWQQSFGLTSSVDWITTEDFSAVESGEIAAEQCKLQKQHISADLCHLSPSNHTVQDLQLFNSVNERNEQEDKEFSSLPNQLDTISATEKTAIISLKREWSLEWNTPKLLQSPLDLGIKYSCPEITSRHDYSQEKCWNSLHCQRKDFSFFSPVFDNHESAAETSQDDHMIWDELPFSESLNEFIARIENNKSTIFPVGLDAHKCSHKKNELDKNLCRTSCRQGNVVVNLQAACTTGSFPQIAENVNTCKEHILSFQSNLTPVNIHISQSEPLYSFLSTSIKGGKKSDFIPSTSKGVLSQSLTVRTKNSFSGESFLQSEEANVNISTNVHSFTDLQCTMKDAESWYAQKREKPTHLHSLYDGCVAKWENKENRSYLLTQRTDLKSSQELGCDSAAPYKSKIRCKRELKPFTDLQENIVRTINQNDLLENNSNNRNSSYNASADLFDASVRDIETIIEFSSKPHSSSTYEDVLTAKCTASELALSPLSVSYPECRSSPSLLPPFGKHSTPISSLYDSELDLVATQNFVPYSQSTPIARPLQKFRSQSGRESLRPKLTPKSPTKIHCKSKQFKPPFKNTLLRQLTSKFLNHERSSNITINKSISQQSFINSQLPGDDSKEWVPPSPTKLLQPVAFSNLKADELQARSLDTSENKANSGKPKTDACLRSRKLNPMNRARIPTTSVSTRAAKALLLKGLVSRTSSCLETKGSRAYASYLVTGLNEAVSWSPELFTYK